jgi:hypothetical protein
MTLLVYKMFGQLQLGEISGKSSGCSCWSSDAMLVDWDRDTHCCCLLQVH